MHVVPEIDAYRISKVATEAITAEKAGMVDYGYTPGATGTSALRAFKEGIKAVRDNYTGPLVCQATTDFIMELELELAGKITATTFSKGGIDTQFLLWTACRLFQHPLTVCTLLSKSMMERQRGRNRAVMKREPPQRMSTSLSAR